MLKASDIFGDVRAHLNDVGNAIFTDTVQLPYLNIAADELQQELENHNIGLTNAVETDIALTAGETEIGGLDLPEGLIEIENVYERISGSSNEYQLMQRVNFLPPVDVLTSYLQWYAFNDQKIQFVGSTSDEQIRVEYIKRRVPNLINASSTIDINGARSVLAYRTAGLCAQEIGENESRAEVMNGNAKLRLDILLSINLKGKQAIVIRRRPFRAGFKFRSRLYR